ncbi:glutathione S-transferase [Herbaspirillum sp. meg3]|uniref:glutathione S-transferase family protein n=1 Tax=Herbaspirillum sp. meg3 TaxID=2025949 RepID=UPI000B98B9E9|nr:glutathione S-transferase N-terminal domain-containing protein [Herbaspirillum sp. meg3]ASU37561.1 glutathione S-transferase [Herbaspirillum sp. meg3]
MLEVYAFATPNSVRIPIALEELGLPYELKSVNVRKGEQKTEVFLALNPNSKVPVLVDSEGPDGRTFVLTESGAILIYLAEKSGKLLPAHGAGRYRVFEQILFHGTGIGPSFGQAGYFQRQAPEAVPFAIARFRNEAARTMGVLDGVLGSSSYVAGDEYTIADIAHFGWMWRREFANVEFTDTPNIARWYEQMMARPAVIRAIERVTALAE